MPADPTVTPEPPHHRHRDPLRYLWQGAVFWLWLAVYVPFLIAAVLLVGRRGRRWLAPRLIRFWGRVTLRAFGVRLVVEPALAAELARKRRRVLTFNHGSTLDMSLMTALWPDDTVAVVKREMLWLPFIGQALYVLDFLPLDRRNRARATASLRAAAERMRQGDLTVLIAPEGTRSRTGELQPFKLGAFHLAAEADAPIVPLVLHGPVQLWPRWQGHCDPGVVTARLLPEQPSGHDDAEPQGARARAAHLHELYARELAAMARTVPVRVQASGRPGS